MTKDENVDYSLAAYLKIAIVVLTVIINFVLWMYQIIYFSWYITAFFCVITGMCVIAIEVLTEWPEHEKRQNLIHSIIIKNIQTFLFYMFFTAFSLYFGGVTRRIFGSHDLNIVIKYIITFVSFILIFVSLLLMVIFVRNLLIRINVLK